MKALAGFIVGGRYQAILVAAMSGILAFLLPPYSMLANYLGAATVALVTLRIGAAQGMLVLVTATVITVLFYQVAGESAAVIAVTMLMLWLLVGRPPRNPCELPYTRTPRCVDTEAPSEFSMRGS